MKEEPHIKIHGVLLSVAKLCQSDASFSRKEGYARLLAVGTKMLHISLISLL
jgi:hypothetical protein